jgi:hypothetical protein
LNVSNYLYSGISIAIQRLIKSSDTVSPEYIKNEYDNLSEALEWYKENCMVSYSYLKNDFDELAKILKEKELI